MDTAPDSPFEYEFEVLAAEQVIVVRARGELTLERLSAFGPALDAHPEFGPEFGVIYDLGACSTQRIMAADVKRLVDLVRTRQLREGFRLVLVVSDDLTFGLGRMYTSLAEGLRDRRRHLTRSFDDALEWLRTHPH